MPIADQAQTTKRNLRKLVVPAAASVAGASAGLLLTRKNTRLPTSLPDLKDLGLGDMVDDLRGKIDTALGKAGVSSSHSAPAMTRSRTFDAGELQARRDEREDRRQRRRAHITT